MKLLELNSALAELTPEDHFHHPGLRYAKFIFCDDKPNENGQGIEREDFAEITRSAIGTPVKIRFLGQSAGGHASSVPIGYISSMAEETAEDGSHLLVASAVLFAHEYPDEITHLEETFAEGKAPGISWELSYHNTILKDGIEWIKGIITRAATFVKNPAYGSRTALLALASNKNISSEELSAELTAFADELSPKNPNKGGNIIVEEELRLAKEALEAANAKIVTLETANAELTTAKTDLETENETLKASVTEKETALAEKEEALAEVAKRDLIAARTKMVTEAGIKVETDAEKLAKKQEFWLQFSEEAFAEYVEDLKVAAKPTKEALASLRPPKVELPRFSSADADNAPTAASDLVSRFRSLRYSDENE